MEFIHIAIVGNDTGVEVQTGRAVDRDDLCEMTFIRSDLATSIKYLCHILRQGSGQTDPENRINDQVGRRGAQNGLDIPRVRSAKPDPTGMVARRVRWQFFGITEEVEINLPTSITQQPGDDETIPAIVARTAEHQCAVWLICERRPCPQYALQNAPTGPLHKREAYVLPLCDRLVLQGTHLLGGQQLGHGRIDSILIIFWACRTINKLSCRIIDLFTVQFIPMDGPCQPEMITEH